MASQGPNAPDDPLTQLMNNIKAVVNLGEISLTDQNAKYVDQPIDADAALYDDYEALGKYVYNPQVIMSPVSSPVGFQGSSVSFCQTGAPTLLWVVAWSATRLTTQPDVPNPYQVIGNDPNWALLRIIPGTAMLTVEADGVTPRYRISGTYVYGHKNPPSNPFDVVNFPKPPYLQNVFQRNMPASKLQANIIN